MEKKSAREAETVVMPSEAHGAAGLEESAKKAFDFASETTKQLLTLSTGIIALTITFAKDFVHQVPTAAISFLVWAWLGYLLSILFGIWTLMALTGTLQAKIHSKKPPTIWGTNVTRPAGLQILSFVAGVACTIAFGIRSLCPIWPFC